MSINVSLGTTKNKSESNSTTTVANVSEVKAGGDVNIVSTKKDIDIIGSNVAGENVKLDAKENLNISASKNTNKTEQSSKSSSASIGAKVNKNNNADYNEKGITPDIGMSASGETESTTKATISEGTIEIRDKENQKQDVNKLNRDTTNSLNKLGEIFDKTKMEERQELANLFGELAYNEIHKLADKHGWQDGDPEKNALHALVGGIMSELTGNGFLAGASASAINEMVQKKLSEQFAGEPDKHQWASAIIGGIVSQLVSGNAQAGASTAASGTKNNEYAKIDAENWYLIGDFIKNFKFDDWQEGEPVFAY